jgi:hypothetical protein
MLDGKLLPQPPAHLAHIISVALIGPGPLTKESLRSIFRVRRDVLRRALLWFKQHNPKHYGHIQISEENLLQYPQDDVPIEVVALARHCEDAGIVDQESAEYVPVNDGEWQLSDGQCK